MFSKISSIVIDFHLDSLFFAQKMSFDSMFARKISKTIEFLNVILQNSK